MSLGRLVEAQAHVTAAVELSKRSGLERFRSDASAVNGLLLVARGNRDAGLCEIEEAVLEAQGLQEQHMNVLRDKAQALEIAGETERALEVQKAIIVMTRQLQMEAMQFVTTALGEPHAGVLEDASPGSTSSHTALFDLARRSRKLLDGASAAPRPRLTRGYLAKRIKAGLVTGFSAGRSQSRS